MRACTSFLHGSNLQFRSWTDSIADNYVFRLVRLTDKKNTDYDCARNSDICVYVLFCHIDEMSLFSPFRKNTNGRSTSTLLREDCGRKSACFHQRRDSSSVQTMFEKNLPKWSRLCVHWTPWRSVQCNLAKQVPTMGENTLVGHVTRCHI